MDFFYVWLRRTLYTISPEIDIAFRESLDTEMGAMRQNDGELIDDASRHDGDKQKSKAAYEDGMFRVFLACHKALKTEGRLVIVFAHKHPDAWETLVSAIIRAGFVVDGSWPIQTEMGNSARGHCLPLRSLPPSGLFARNVLKPPARLGQSCAGRDAREHRHTPA